MAFVYRGEQVDLGFGRGWLNRPAAQSIRRIDRQIGHALQVSEAGRTWDQQNRFFQLFLSGRGAIALNPDTPSVHQYGGAIDSDEAQGILAILEDHGWRRTVYRWVNGAWTLVERWHFEYFEHLDNHRNDPDPKEEDMQQDERDALFAIKAALLDGHESTGFDRSRISVLFEQTNDMHSRLFVYDEHGVPVWDAFQELRQNVRATLVAVASLPAQVPADVDKLADAIFDGLDDEFAGKIIDRMAQRLAAA
ncbi:hypothetical protein [uncultured Microbacterium sp.]|uniref:hypothetical protein n=1 Tax=uncultured Microbacterium sp. TaxID=191216 RepID=UPI0025DA4588|nr:hypothetical protein [uncultured Microbacterium sp.]